MDQMDGKNEKKKVDLPKKHSAGVSSYLSVICFVDHHFINTPDVLKTAT